MTSDNRFLIIDTQNDYVEWEFNGQSLTRLLLRLWAAKFRKRHWIDPAEPIRLEFFNGEVIFHLPGQPF